ncbi:MAG: PHP domain-containing protein [Mycoplasmataceae bacterium]|nr:PHP domain-containing protein [Mycoplasmataceae bacterium]
MKKFQYIYHLHEKICGHAKNTIDFIVEQALKEGFKEIYFTEHCPLLNNQCIYRPTINEIAELHKKIKMYNIELAGKLKIYFGYEAEFNKQHADIFLQLINDPFCEFVIFGNHYLGDMWNKKCKWVGSECFFPIDLQDYLENLIAALEANVFSLIAHPDLWLTSYRKWDEHAKELTKKIISYAKKYNVPLGFNANGYAHKLTKGDEFHYPCKYFWEEVAKSDAKVLIECDSHSPWTFNNQTMQQAYEYAVSLGLKNNLVEKIDIKWLKKTSNQ